MKKDGSLDEVDVQILNDIRGLNAQQTMAKSMIETEWSLDEVAESMEETGEELIEVKPNWGTLKETTGLSEESLHRRLKNLSDAGYITKRKDREDKRKKIYTTTKKTEEEFATQGFGWGLNSIANPPDFENFGDFLTYLGGCLVFARTKIEESDIDTEFGWKQFVRGFLSAEKPSFLNHLGEEVLPNLKEAIKSLQSERFRYFYYESHWEMLEEQLEKAPSGESDGNGEDSSE